MQSHQKNGQTLTQGSGPNGTTSVNRLNVNNVAANPLIYDASLGTTVYGNTAAASRGSRGGNPSSEFYATGTTGLTGNGLGWRDDMLTGAWSSVRPQLRMISVPCGHISCGS